MYRLDHQDIKWFLKKERATISLDNFTEDTREELENDINMI